MKGEPKQKMCAKSTHVSCPENLLGNIYADRWEHPDSHPDIEYPYRFHLFNVLSVKLHHLHLQFAMPTTSASSGVGNVEPKY